jgi:acyl-coenzyme A synthetase/AMP-(fatty) acid ligase
VAYKYPRQIKFVQSLPKSAVGNILRRVIRDKEKYRNKLKMKKIFLFILSEFYLLGEILFS